MPFAEAADFTTPTKRTRSARVRRRNTPDRIVVESGLRVVVVEQQQPHTPCTMEQPHDENSHDDDNDAPPPPRTLDDFLQVAAVSYRTSTTAAISSCSQPQEVTCLTLSPSSDDDDDNYSNHHNHSRSNCHFSQYYPWRYWAVFVSLGVANSSDASEILCLSYILSESHFEATILRHAPWRAGLLAATVFAGMLLGGLLVGCLGDWWGRRPLLLYGLTVNAGAGVVSAAAWNVWVLAACRFVAGIGIGATVPPLFCLCSELAPPAARGFWVTVAASFWMVGSVYVAVVAWCILGGNSNDNEGDDAATLWPRWRWFVTACALPSCLGCLLVHRNVPESPRFLLLQGRHDEAVAVIQRLADAMRYKGPPLTKRELLHQYPLPTVSPSTASSTSASNNSSERNNDSDGLMMRRRSASNDDDDEYSASAGTIRRRSTRLSWYAELSIMLKMALQDFVISASVLYTPQLRSTTFPLQMVWFCLSFGSYGLLTWINTLFFLVHLENVYFNALLFAASNLPGNLMSAYLMDKAGRARLLTGSVLAAALSLVAFAYVAAANTSDEMDESATAWIVGSACAFQCFTVAAWNTIDVLTSELFPTSVRSTGMGVCAATGRIGAMLAQFVNGALVSHPVRLLLTAATTLLLGSLTPVLLPADQTGRPVQDFAGVTTDTDNTVVARVVAPSSHSSGTSLSQSGDSRSSFGKGHYERIDSLGQQTTDVT